MHRPASHVLPCQVQKVTTEVLRSVKTPRHLRPASFLLQNQLHIAGQRLRQQDGMLTVADLVQLPTQIHAIVGVDGVEGPPQLSPSFGGVGAEGRGVDSEGIRQAWTHLVAGDLVPDEQLQSLLELLQGRDCYGLTPVQRTHESMRVLDGKYAHSAGLRSSPQFVQCLALRRCFLVSRLMLTALGYGEPLAAGESASGRARGQTLKAPVDELDLLTADYALFFNQPFSSTAEEAKQRIQQDFTGAAAHAALQSLSILRRRLSARGQHRKSNVGSVVGGISQRREQLPAEVEIVITCCVRALEASDDGAPPGSPSAESATSPTAPPLRRVQAAAAAAFRRALLDIRDESDGTLLFAAAGVGAVRLVQLLLAQGADYVELPTSDNRSALHAAAGSENRAVCELLLKRTQLPFEGEAAKASDGSTPLDCCTAKFRQELERMARKVSYVAFLSHYKAEAAAEARYIHDALERSLERNVFLDSDNLTHLKELKESVINSDVLIAFQTPRYLLRPYCLVEILTAIEKAKPILGLRIESHSEVYNFEEMKLLMDDFPNELRRRAPGAAEVLECEGFDLDEAGRALSSTIPFIISASFNSHWGHNMLKGAVQDLLDNLARAQPTPEVVKIHKEMSRSRSRGAPKPGIRKESSFGFEDISPRTPTSGWGAPTPFTEGAAEWSVARSPSLDSRLPDVP